MHSPIEKDLDVVVVGSANYDYTLVADHLPRPGETVTGRDLRIGIGGKGTNQAVACARLGGRVAFIGRVGLADGADMIDALEAEGIDIAQVERDSRERTGMAMIAVDAAGEKQIIISAGANGRLRPDALDRADVIFRRGRVLLTQLEIPVETVVEAVSRGRRAGMLAVLDPAPGLPDLPDELFGMLDLIRPNAHEAEILTGIRVDDRDSARRAARELLRRGARAASVQAGPEGDLLLWSDGELFLPRFPVTSVDATGAGDAFAGAMALEMARGRALAEAGPTASAAAALTTTRPGARDSLPTAAEVARFLASHHA